MTCVIGMIDNGDVWMGADSCASNSYTKTVRNDPKIFTNGDYLIGCTSSFRMTQILMTMDLPKYKKKKGDIFKFMITEFIETVRDQFKTLGYSDISNNRESGGHFLVGLKGRLFKIEGDFQVGESAYLYDTCGNGGDVAMGAMEALLKYTDSDPCVSLERALRIASHHAIGVESPFIIYKNREKVSHV